MTDTIESGQTKIRIGAEQSYKNLSMFPLVADHAILSEDLTIDKALARGLVDRDVMDEIKSAPEYNVADISGEKGSVAAAWNYIEQFARVDGQVGAVFLINGKIAGQVCLDDAKAFEKSFIIILECYAIRAVKAFAAARDLKSLKSEVIDFMRSPSKSQVCVEVAF